MILFFLIGLFLTLRYFGVLRSPAMTLVRVVVIAAISAVGADDRKARCDQRFDTLASTNLPQREVATLRVITHGFRSPLESAGPPPWAFELQDVLLEKGPDRCIVFDWAAESNNASPGWAEAAGDALFATIMRHLLDLDRPVHIHLIGYSRGAVVNSEAHRHLAWYRKRYASLHERVRRIDITWLDPHPANGTVGFSSKSPFLTDRMRTFERLAADPDVTLWPGTTSVELCYQHGEPASEDSPLNPWGMASDASLAGQVGHAVDLTQQPFVTREGRTVPMDHYRVPEWYVQHVRAQTPQDKRPPALIASESIAADTPKLLVAELSTAREQTVVFNGDFSHGGEIADWWLRWAAETNRLPGWTCTGDAWVARNGQLRLQATRNAEKSCAAVATHKALFLAAEQTTLAFTVGGISRIGDCDAQLDVTFVPVESDKQGNLRPVAEAAQHQRLATWDLAELCAASARDELSVPLPPCDGLGQAGCLQFAFSASSLGTATLSLDGVCVRSGGDRVASARVSSEGGPSNRTN